MTPLRRSDPNKCKWRNKDLDKELIINLKIENFKIAKKFRMKNDVKKISSLIIGYYYVGGFHFFVLALFFVDVSLLVDSGN